MEIPVSAPALERERERERVNSSLSFPRRHKILFGIIVITGILLYAGFNLWVYRYSKSGKGPSLNAGPRQAVSNSSPAPPPAKQDLAPPDTPTPRLTGPGEYACDPYGVCNRYGDAARKEFCPVTFADSLCLDQCADKEKQCKQ